MVAEPLAKKVHFDADQMWVELADGRQLGVPLAYFPRLLRATAQQRENYTISGGGTGLHWQELDEDIRVRSLLMDLGDKMAGRSLKRKSSKVRETMILHVQDAQYQGQFRIWLRFNDGAEGVVDLEDYLDGPMFEPLREPERFKMFRVDPDIKTIVWDNGADLSPDFLYDKMSPSV